MNDLDHRAFFLIYAGEAGPSMLYVVMVALTAIGSGWSMLALLPMFAMFRTRRLATSLLATFLATSVIVFFAKAILGRARPCVALAGVHALFGAPTDPSFPSGHAAGAFAFAGFVATLALSGTRTPGRMAVTFGAFVLALGVATSRVYLGCHFPADVLGGAIVGTALGIAGARWHVARSTV